VGSCQDPYNKERKGRGKNSIEIYLIHVLCDTGTFIRK
jgi:hypothetical protein